MGTYFSPGTLERVEMGAADLYDMPRTDCLVDAFGLVLWPLRFCEQTCDGGEEVVVVGGGHRCFFLWLLLSCLPKLRRFHHSQ